jgi:hypothetical protein
MFETRIATTAEEKEAVFRFRYAIYVEEMGRYLTVADHAGRRLVDPEDAWSWIVSTTDDGEVVASTRMTWGGDGFSDRQIRQYGLAPFLAEIPAHHMVVGERTMISAARRGCDLFTVMTEAMPDLCAEHDVRMVFGACEPHLLSFYLRYQRTYAPRNINSAEAGYLIPLISFTNGIESMIGVGDGLGLPRCINGLLDSTGAVTSPMLGDRVEYEREILAAIHQLPDSVFYGMSGDEIAQCTARSNVIRCAEGDRVLKKGGAARNAFVVLSGALEARDDERVVGVILPGEIFGETAHLLQEPRTLDVDALSDETLILSLSEHTLHELTEHHPVVAAKLYRNISRTLSLRMCRAR